MKTPNRDELIAAQFMLKPELYVAWIWQERTKAYPPVSKLQGVVIPFKWRANNVIPLRKRGG